MDVSKELLGLASTAGATLLVTVKVLWAKLGNDAAAFEKEIATLHADVASRNAALLEMAEARRADQERAGIAIAQGVSALQRVTEQLARLMREGDQPPGARNPDEERRR